MGNTANESNYSIALQFAMMELCGKKWDGTAGLFTTDEYIADALKKAIEKIRTRIEEIAATDDKLRISCQSQITCLQSEIKKYSGGKGNLLDIAAHLITLIAFLIGFDYWRGIPNRSIIYYQTKEQRERDDNFFYKNSPPPEDKTVFYQLVEIASMLHKKSYSILDISRIMKRPTDQVRHFLKHSDKD